MFWLQVISQTGLSGQTVMFVCDILDSLVNPEHSFKKKDKPQGQNDL